MMPIYAQIEGEVNDLPLVLRMPDELDVTARFIEHEKMRLFKHRLRKPVENKDVRNVLREHLALDRVAVAPANMQVVHRTAHGGFSVLNILFQTFRGVYAPANLYVPEGDGVFPAILLSHGHWPEGKMGDIVQQTAQLLVRNGYVVLCMDAWGSGERGTGHLHEYHGSNLGSSLLDFGIPLMGIQLLENTQGVNILSELPYVDKDRIGATGASGGGNQTFWLAAYDERIKAAVPVVSVGTFDAYLLNSNCVCELLPSGLCHMESADVLSSTWPRPVHCMTALRDGNAAFNVGEMLKTHQMANERLSHQGRKSHLSYALFDEAHDYSVSMQHAMLHWFDEQFGFPHRIDGAPYRKLDAEILQVGRDDHSRRKITTTLGFWEDRKGKEVESLSVPLASKRIELEEMLSLPKEEVVVRVDSLDTVAGWHRHILTTNSQHLIPLLVRIPEGEVETVHVFFPSKGTHALEPQSVDAIDKPGNAMVIVDLFGIGQRRSQRASRIDGALPRFHTLSRSMMWLGQSMMGRWVAEILMTMEYVDSRWPRAVKLVNADRETALAALCFSALGNSSHALQLHELASTYIPEQRAEGDAPLDMSIHMQGIVPWGDVATLAALSKADIEIKRLISLNGIARTDAECDRFVETVNRLKRKAKINSKLNIN